MRHIYKYYLKISWLCLWLFLPPALAKEVIFSVASICLSVCLFEVCRLNRRTYRPKICTHIKDHRISNYLRGQGHRSKVKVTKVKNEKIQFLA